jgi:Ca2+-binding RTX toxin-like protein
MRKGDPLLAADHHMLEAPSMSNTTSSVTVTEILSHPSVPAKTAWGGVLADQPYFATVMGSAAAETFDVADLSARTQALMGAHKRGVTVDMGGGNDRITGSAYGDYIIAGPGINHIDGGANGGSTPSGGEPQDVLQITVASSAAANAVQVLALPGSADAADISAALAGYRYKVVAPGETDYIKGIERVAIVNTESGSPSIVREIFLTARVQEIDAPYHGAYRQIAWVNGTEGADGIDLASGSTLLPASLADRMASGKQGALIFGGSGDDIITGTAYADHIRNGEGNARIDGGAHNAAPGLFVGKDIFEITVPTQADLDAIVVSASDDPLYTWMVTYGAGSTQKDYLRNVEGINAFAATGGNGRWIALAMDVHEVSGPDLGNFTHLVWAPGTTQDDSFDAAVDISAATQALMATYGRGAHVRTYAGNDTITGSAYGDEIDAGEGINHVDGGANGGLRPSGEKAEDVLRIRVADRAAIDAVQVVVLNPNAGSAQDRAEFNSGYTHKVVSGGATDYIRNIERIIIQDDHASSRHVWLAVTVHEADLAAPDFANYPYIAWIDGTDGADAINLASGSLLSAELAAQMATDNEGIAVEGGAGEDVVTGSSFSDRIDGGAGTNYIDGGGNGASLPDVLAAHAASKADFDAATVIELSSASAGADLAAFNSGYLFKLVNGTTQVDYFKNIEEVRIDYWTDANANGQFDTGEHGIRSITMTVAISGSRITGTSFGDTFVAATDLSADTLALMASTDSGISANMGAGDDTIVGSAYQDNINAGTGTNHVDGGDQGVWNGGTPRDNLAVTPLSQADFDALAVTELSSASTAADLAAFNSGYTFKVTSGAAETDYLKNVESVTAQFWNDVNGNGRRDSGETRSKLVSLTVGIFEERADPANPGYLIDGGPIAEVSKLAHVTGTPFADTFDAGADLTATGRALMDSALIGMYIDTGAGNDIIKTSAYADQIIAGTGVNHIDGGAGVDTLDVYVTSQAAALAVQTLSAASTGADAAAFAAGYLYKLDAGAEADYLINIEQVRVYLWNDKNGDGRVTHAAAGSATNEATLVVTLIGNPDPLFG